MLIGLHTNTEGWTGLGNLKQRTTISIVTWTLQPPMMWWFPICQKFTSPDCQALTNAVINHRPAKNDAVWPHPGIARLKISPEVLDSESTTLSRGVTSTEPGCRSNSLALPLTILYKRAGCSLRQDCYRGFGRPRVDMLAVWNRVELCIEKVVVLESYVGVWRTPEKGQPGGSGSEASGSELLFGLFRLRFAAGKIDIFMPTSPRHCELRGRVEGHKYIFASFAVLRATLYVTEQPWSAILAISDMYAVFQALTSQRSTKKLMQSDQPWRTFSERSTLVLRMQ